MMRSLREDTATFDNARDAWTPADVVAGVALDLSDHIHSLDTLSENDVTFIAPCAGIGSDEKLVEKSPGEQ